VKRWRNKAQDRKEWSAVLREAKAERAVKPEKKQRLSKNVLGLQNTEYL
jgi:hypothetical protein